MYLPRVVWCSLKITKEIVMTTKTKKPVFVNNVTDEVSVDLVSELKRETTKFTSRNSLYVRGVPCPWIAPTHSPPTARNFNRRWCPHCIYEPMVMKDADGKPLKYALCKSCGHKENI